MKRLYLIGGPMGVGKTAVGQRMKRMLDNAVYLDGDWLWDADPFQVTPETKGMVTDNICHVLNGFLCCREYENVIFTWVMHEQAIIDGLLARLRIGGTEVRCVSLICEADALAARLQRDIDAGIRKPDVIPRSLAYLPKYGALDTVIVDVTHMSVETAAEYISRL